MAMIVSCPSCATTYRLADGEEPADGELIRCAGCGHSWLEASARGMEKRTGAAPGGAAGSVHEMRESMLHEAGGAEASPAEDADDPDAALLLPVPLAREEMAGFDDMSGGLDDEAAILAREALAAEQERRRRMAARRRERLRWAALILFLVVGGGLLWSYPDAVSRHLPGMARLYAMAGIEVNPRGFDIATVRAERTTTLGGDRVLTVRGSLRNVGRTPRQAPGLRFVLRDAKGGALHAWELKAVSARPAPSGRPVEFVTRLADPPAEAARVEVRLLPGA